MSEAKKTETTAAKKDESRGAWVVVDDTLQVIVIESSEIKAFRAAQPYRARIVFWGFGVDVGTVLGPLADTATPVPS